MEVKTPQETNLYSLGSMSNGNITQHDAVLNLSTQNWGKAKTPIFTLGPHLRSQASGVLW